MSKPREKVRPLIDAKGGQSVDETPAPKKVAKKDQPKDAAEAGE